MSSKKRTLNCM